jgi:hypothetical protein
MSSLNVYPEKNDEKNQHHGEKNLLSDEMMFMAALYFLIQLSVTLLE